MTVLRKFFQPAAVAGAAVALAAMAAPAVAMDAISYKHDVYPIIQHRCLECHMPEGEGYKKSGLDLRTYESLMKGTKFGPIVVPKSAFTSNLNVLVEGRADKGLRMPHNRKKLTNCEIGILRRWVNQGALNN